MRRTPKTAFETKLGKIVAKSIIYRMLERGDWREIAPRPRPPKADLAAQVAIKKLETEIREEVDRRSKASRRVRLMFQDEVWFGLLGDQRRCWAPKGIRPVVGAT